MLFEQGAHRLGGLHLQIETCGRALGQRLRSGKAQGTGDQDGVSHARSLGPDYLVSSRIASSSPRSVKGYMRWFISC